MSGVSRKFPCPTCRHQRTADRCWNCDVPVDAARVGVGDFVAAVVVVSALQPFVSAIATKAGEEVWPKIAGLVGRRRRREIEARIESTEMLEMVSHEGRLVIEVPKRLPTSAAASLRDVVTTLERAEGRFRVSYDAATSSWSITSEGTGAEPSDI